MLVSSKQPIFIVLISIVSVAFSMSAAFAADETLTYTYDQNLQLTRVQYGSGAVVEYAYDNVGNRMFKTTAGSTPVNQPPNAPSSPTVANGATNVSTTPTLGWTGGDPDAGDQVLYAISFGPSGNLAVIASGTQTTYQPRQLQALTQYCWQIKARDTHNAETTGPTWCFTTRNDPPVADFAVDPASGIIPLSVAFTDTSTSPDDKIVSWAWDIDNNGSTDSTQQNFSYTYPIPGSYTVKLTVTDEHGSANTKIAANAITVQAYGSISGRVSNEATSQGIQGIEVSVTSGPSSGWTYTDSAGNYTITNLKPGTYLVYTSNNPGYVGEYYNNQPDWSSATLVTVNSGANTPNINFALTPTGSISGKITNEATGQGLQGIEVDVTSGPSSGWTYTDSSGNYTITNLKPGTYKVYSSNNIGYVDEYYNNQPDSSSATLVTVNSGVNTANINFALTPPGSISGRVTHATTGAGIAYAWVRVSDGPSYNGYAYTDASGYYSIPNLEPGQYKVYTSYTAGYTDGYYNNAADYSSATLVTVSSNATVTNINFTLTPAATAFGSLAGRVTNEQTGVGLPGVRVYVSDGPSYGSATTDAFGRYAISNLNPGQYKVYTYYTSGYMDEYFNNATESTATLVTVNASANTPNINFALTPRGTISGAVTNENTGALLQGVRVYAEGPSYVSTTTDASGNYAIANLAPGQYKVYTYYTDGYVDEYYNNVTDSAAATLVTVTAGVNTPNINFALTPKGTISGAVTNENTGAPLQEVRIYAEGPSSVSTMTDASGNYTIANLAPGQYKVYTYYATGYVDEYYNNVTDSAAATLVIVTAGANTPNINFALTPRGTISGTVTNEITGAPVSGVRVDVWDGPSSGNATTDATGNYTIANLVPGQYKVYIYSTTMYVGEYYNNVTDYNAATLITVTAGANTPNINFALTPRGAISGSVIDEQTGLGLEDIVVYASNGTSSGNAKTNEIGYYTISNLAPGQYKVYTDSTSGYLSEYYNNATEATATLVTVSAGATTSNIHFSLIRAQEMNVKQGANIIPTNGNYHYGTVSVGGNVPITFTIVNAGHANLDLTGYSEKVIVSGANAAEFSVTLQPTSPVAPGGSTTCTIRFAPTVTGTRTATISIANNDNDENPYTFTVTGTGQAQASNSYLLWTK